MRWTRLRRKAQPEPPSYDPTAGTRVEVVVHDQEAGPSVIHGYLDDFDIRTNMVPVPWSEDGLRMQYEPAGRVATLHMRVKPWVVEG